MRHATFAALLVLLALRTAAQAADPGLPPTRMRPLVRWLTEGTYRATYTPEPAVRASATAHGMHVRTWYSPALTADLAAGTVPFRRGAAMVKELYFAGTDTVLGWSVMRKVRRRSAGGRGWFFFETFDGRTAIARGRGVGICVGCHADGTDFLLTEFRPAP
jgi:hypothetical protein